MAVMLILVASFSQLLCKKSYINSGSQLGVNSQQHLTMMRRGLMSWFLGVVFLSVACRAIRAASLVPALFLFGDSLLDVGTNEFLPNSSDVANFPPYGETYFHKPSGRFSNGLITSDFLARFLKLPFLPPYLKPGADLSQGANFASAGSGILDTTNTDSVLVPFNTQVQQFQQLVSAWKKEQGDAVVVQEKLSKSIFFLTTGSNDLLGGYLFNSTAQDAYSPRQYAQLLTKQYGNGLQTLYQAGARKIAISALGPLGCTPALRLYASAVQGTPGCLNSTNQLSLAFNEELQGLLLNELSAQLPDAKFVYVKPYDFFMDMINNGKKYGFTVTENNCCGAGPYNALVACGRSNPSYKPFLCHRPSKYLFWDFHPTQQASLFISNAIWSGDTSVVKPMNLKELVEL